MEVSTKFCIRWRVATTSAWSTPGWTSTAWARTSGAGWTGRRPARTGATLAVRTRPRRRRRRGGSSAKETRIYFAAAGALLPFTARANLPLFVSSLGIFVHCLVLSLPGLWEHVLDLMKERLCQITARHAMYAHHHLDTAGLHPADMCSGHVRMCHKYITITACFHLKCSATWIILMPDSNTSYIICFRLCIIICL